MKSKRVGHGRALAAVCGALVSASTFAAASPREMTADYSAHLASFSRPEAIVTDEVASPALHRSLADASGRLQVLVRLRSPSVAVGKGAVTREKLVAEQAAFISQMLARAPSTDVITTVQLVLNAVVLDVDAADL